LFLILKGSKEPQSELQNYSQEIARQQNELQRQNQKIAEYGQTISQLQDKIQQLESKLQEVQHSSPQIVVPVQTPLYASSVSPAPEPAQSSQSHQEEVFYLSTPNSDGSFNRSSASSEYREGASVYRFMKTSHNPSDSVEKFTVNEFNLLRDVLRSSRNGLNHLNHLPTIETKISEFKTESLTQQQQIKELHQTLNALLTNTKEIIELLRQIQSESVLRRIVALFTRANTKKV
jgi:septal ring factor EnvC (AmiA/AmiB activator)